MFPSGKSKRPFVSGTVTRRTRHPATLPPTPSDDNQDQAHEVNERAPLLGHRKKQQERDSTTSIQPSNKSPWKQHLHNRRISTIAAGVTAAAGAAIATSLPLSPATPKRHSRPKVSGQTSKQRPTGAQRSRDPTIKPCLCSLNLCVVYTTLTSTKALPRTTEFGRDWIDKPSDRFQRCRSWRRHG
jgi:hypothetical protein